LFALRRSVARKSQLEAGPSAFSFLVFANLAKQGVAISDISGNEFFTE
jgi:hypothetical protein